MQGPCALPVRHLHVWSCQLGAGSSPAMTRPAPSELDIKLSLLLLCECQRHLPSQPCCCLPLKGAGRVLAAATPSAMVIHSQVPLYSGGQFLAYSQSCTLSGLKQASTLKTPGNLSLVSFKGASDPGMTPQKEEIQARKVGV